LGATVKSKLLSVNDKAFIGRSGYFGVFSKRRLDSTLKNVRAVTRKRYETRLIHEATSMIGVFLLSDKLIFKIKGKKDCEE